LIDFYLNRDDYTQKYCQLLDEGITTCRASCHLANLLEEQQNKKSDTKIISVEKVKLTEMTNQELSDLNIWHTFENENIEIQPNTYHFEYLHIVFHPPKRWLQFTCQVFSV